MEKLKKIFKNKRNIYIGLIIICLISVGYYFWSIRNGRFVYTGNTIEQRTGQTATLLQDGTVLVTGGSLINNNKILDSAEIYNPKTGKFTGTNGLTSPRVGHSAVLLNDGRVLITGGYDNGKTSLNELKSAEIYNPKAETFTKIKNMNHAWTDHQMILLNDGNVFLGSNISNSLKNVKSEIFNTKKNIFLKTESCRTMFCPNKSILLNNNKILLVVGEFPQYRSQIFDLEKNNFKFTGNMIFNRSYSTATLLKDGRVIIIGGTNNSHEVEQAEIYNPKTDKFILAAKLNQPRHSHSSILLPNGKVLVVGGTYGHSDMQKHIKLAELYDPITNTFIKIGFTKDSIDFPTLTLLKNGNVLIMGDGMRPELYID